MRSRLPQHLELKASDVAILRRIARSQALPWYQVRRARTVMGIAAGERVQTLAEQLHYYTPQTVRQICQRYERQGLAGVLARPNRPGGPFVISPSAARAHCSTDLSGTGC